MPFVVMRAPKQSGSLIVWERLVDSLTTVWDQKVTFPEAPNFVSQGENTALIVSLLLTQFPPENDTYCLCHVQKVVVPGILYKLIEQDETRICHL